MKLNLYLFILAVISTVSVYATKPNIDLSILDLDITDKINESKCKVNKLISCQVQYNQCFLKNVLNIKKCIEEFKSCIVKKCKSEDLNSFEPNKDNVKILGRAIYQNGYLWFGMTDSGVEYTFNGKTTTISVTADTASFSEDNPAYIAIYADGEVYEKTLIKEKDTDFTVNFDKKGKHTVTFIKLSESERGSLRINEIKADVKKIIPTPEKKKKIEFLGDSITCAYGIDGTGSDTFSTTIQDGSKSYAYLTAKKFDADYSIVAHSGICIFKNVPFNGDDTPFVLPPLYDKLGLTMGPNIYDDGVFFLQETTWDFKQYEPDLIVINLGTNDDYYFLFIDESLIDSEKSAFIQSYEDFITYLRNIYPNAEILCTLGMMGQALYPEIEQAVNNYTTKTGDSHVHSFKFSVQDAEKNGLGADGHPNAKSHLIATQELVDEIEKLYGWKSDPNVKIDE